jgi:glutamate/tyrosine decarboxylase-like PLP-dependent enzyme
VTERSSLFPAARERALWNDHLTRALAEAERQIAQGPVTPRTDFDSFKAQLAVFDFRAPRPIGELLNWTIAGLKSGLVHINHPRYLGLFNPAPTFPAQCADRIAGSFNPQLATATTSPAAVAIEAHVIQSVARRVGLPAGSSGHFTSGGSEANFTALVCALTSIEPSFTTDGARAFSGQPVFYISGDSHLAWIKIAHMAGIGRSAARLVPTDGAGRMCTEVLAATIAADRGRGCVPFMMVGTAGTTNAGVIDPLPHCADIAEANDLWFHVDAAWGGALIASNRLRGLLRGMELAHSITIDAHKWFATTMGCGMFLTVRPPILTKAFGVATSYMPSHEPEVDPYITTSQWSRRFLGLRLFLSLGHAGWDGYAAHVERAIELAQLLAGAVASLGWSIVNDPALAVVCMEPPPGSRPVRGIVRDILDAGGAWLSIASFAGRDVIRACVTHGETSATDIQAIVQLLEEARA